MTSHRIWREPFLHFTLLGVFIFAADAWLRDRSDAASSGEIVVTAGRIENLSAMFEKTWQRPPTAQELQGLVDSYILDEALFREGVALGMDQDDNVIRRRVRQKVDFLVDDLAGPAEPDDAELQARLDMHTDDYALPAVFTFYQIYLNPERHGDSLDTQVDHLLAELASSNTNIDIDALGDATLLDSAYVDYRADLVTRNFGERFAAQLEEAAIGAWSGPVESAFGVHIVFVEAMTPARIPELNEVRDSVARDWRRDQRELAVVEFHAQTVSKYDVSIEWPSASDAGAEADK